MKVGSTILESGYRNKIENKPPVFKRKAEEGTAQRRGPLSEDTVDLSGGFSLERIQGFLQTEIGKKIDKMMADAGVDFSAAAGLDWSPEATSQRIFDMATGLFGVWRDQHPDMDESALIDSFEKVIRSSVDQGAEEASVLIGAAGVSDETQDVTSKTMSLLHEKLDAHFSDLRSRLDVE